MTVDRRVSHADRRANDSPPSRRLTQGAFEGRVNDRRAAKTQTSEADAARSPWRMAWLPLLLAVNVAWGQAGAESVEVQHGDGNRPAIFLGNETLPPICFMEGGKPRGIVVDLAESLAKHMQRPVEVRLTDWGEAQRLVQEGRAEALL